MRGPRLLNVLRRDSSIATVDGRIARCLICPLWYLHKSPTNDKRSLESDLDADPQLSGSSRLYNEPSYRQELDLVN